MSALFVPNTSLCFASKSLSCLRCGSGMWSKSGSGRSGRFEPDAVVFEIVGSGVCWHALRLSTLLGFRSAPRDAESAGLALCSSVELFSCITGPDREVGLAVTLARAPG